MKETLLDNDYLKIESEDNILIGTIKSDFIDLNTARKITDFRLEVQKGTSNPLLSNIKAIKHGTKEARDFLASEKGSEGIIVLAILIGSPIGSMIGNFWMQINKPLKPTKIFTDEAEAKKWLAQFAKKD